MDERRHEKTDDPQRMVDAASAIMVMLDHERRITAASRRFHELFGAAQRDRCHVVLKRRLEPCRQCPVAAAFADGRTHCSQETLMSGSGRPMAVMTWAEPFCDGQGRVQGVLRLSTGIGPSARAAAGVGTVLPADQTHGWRGLITALDGGLYQLERAAGAGRWEQIPAAVEQMRQCVGRLRGKILDLLEGRSAAR